MSNSSDTEERRWQYMLNEAIKSVSTDLIKTRSRALYSKPDSCDPKHVYLTEFVNMYNLSPDDIQIVSENGELWLYYWATERLYAPGEYKEDQ